MTVAFIVVLACTVVAGSTAHADRSSACPAVTVFGLRGSYENSSDDDALGGILQSVAANLPKSVVVRGVPGPAYPATVLPSANSFVIDGVTVLTGGLLNDALALADAVTKTRQSYDDSRAKGYSALADQIRSLVASCPTSKFALMGYSQGAHIAADMTQTLLNEGLSGAPAGTGRNRWLGTVVFGDPAFNPSGGDSLGDFTPSFWGAAGRRAAYPDAAHGRMVSLCAGNDVICGLPRSVGAVALQAIHNPVAHFYYATTKLPGSQTETYAQFGALWLTRLIDETLAAPPTATTAAPNPTGAVPPPPSPSVVLAQGPVAGAGYRYAVTLRSFAPNAAVSVVCHDSVSSAGFFTFTMRTDASGSASTANQCLSGDGPDHWVTANGLESNHVTWGAVPGQTPPSQSVSAPPPQNSSPVQSPPTFTEQEGHLGVNTFTNYHNASGLGPRIAPNASVQVSCKVHDPTIASVNPDGYWYRIASSPWNDAYYSPANTFMNGDPAGGPYTHNTDFSVPDC